MDVYWIHTGCPAGTPSLQGAIKETEDDFKVSEMDLQGRVVEAAPLGPSSTAPEVPEEPAFVSAYLQWKRNPNQAEAPQDGAASRVKPLEEVVPEEVCSQLAELAQRVAAVAASPPPDVSAASDRSGGDPAPRQGDSSNRLPPAAVPDALRVEVGHIPDKDRRRDFNNALRVRYPCLTMSSVEQSICATPCEVFPVMSEAFGRDAAEKIVRFAVSPDRDPIVCRYTTDSKEVKRKLNKQIGLRFGALLLSTRDGVCSIAKKAPKRKRCNVEQPFTHFVLWKRGIAWFDAVRAIGGHTGCHDNDILSAGLKDKRAVTTQRACLRGAYAPALAALERDDMKMSDITYSTEPLQTGALTGNRFDIVIRHVALRDATNTPSVEQTDAAATTATATTTTTADAVVADVPDGDDDDDDEGGISMFGGPPAKKSRGGGGGAAATSSSTSSGSSPAAAPSPGSGTAFSVLASNAERVFRSGFPNFFGPQRFSYVCRRDLHVGLCLVQQDFEKALEVLMTPTPEDSEEIAALKGRYQFCGGDTRQLAKDFPPSRTAEREALFAKHRLPGSPDRWFRSVPFGMREMWVHSLQSWLWNMALYARIEKHGLAVLPGDLLLPPHRAGTTFPKQQPEVCRDPSGHSVFEVVLPKAGGGSIFPDNDAGAIYDTILARYGVTRSDWDMKASGVKLSPSYRHIFVRPQGGEVVPNPEEGSVRATFCLPTSCYATVCLGSMLNNVVV